MKLKPKWDMDELLFLMDFPCMVWLVNFCQFSIVQIKTYPSLELKLTFLENHSVAFASKTTSCIKLRSPETRKTKSSHKYFCLTAYSRCCVFCCAVLLIKKCIFRQYKECYTFIFIIMLLFFFVLKSIFVHCSI